MSRITFRAALAVAVLTGTLAGPAQAGQTCEPYSPSVQQVSNTTELALKTQQALLAGGQRVYFLARAGQDLTKYGLRYSHGALAVRNAAGTGFDVYHLLNDCGTATSGIYRQGLLEFFGDSLYRYQAVAVTLPPDVQLRVATLLQNAPKTMHQPAYSLTAYPFSTKFQNSNQWVLETLATAMSTDLPVATRSQAQTWLKEAGYRPSELHLGPLTRLGGRMTKAQITFEDHPGSLRWADQIQTTTVDATIRFLRERYPDDARVQEVSL